MTKIVCLKPDKTGLNAFLMGFTVPRFIRNKSAAYSITPKTVRLDFGIWLTPSSG